MHCDIINSATHTLKYVSTCRQCTYTDIVASVDTMVVAQ